MQNKGQKAKRVVLWMLLLALILVPFALFGERIDAWTETFIESGSSHRLAAMLVLGGLLGGDILLPVPSSIVSTACGMLFGWIGGALVSLAGMTISCIAGFWLARCLGRPFVERFAGHNEIERVKTLNARYGAWAIILARPIPVLAEASVLVVGLGAVPFRRFLLVSTLSNLGISLVYSVAGSLSSDFHSFLPALGASIALPWLMMTYAKRGNAASGIEPVGAAGDKT